MRISAALLALVLVVSSAKAESVVPAAEAIALQAAMQSHIEANLVGGALLYLDAKTGVVGAYYPAKAHPKIMRIGPYYYLCANFRDADGQEVMINFFVAEDDGKFVFFHTLLGEDEALEERIEKAAGKLTN